MRRVLIAVMVIFSIVFSSPVYSIANQPHELELTLEEAINRALKLSKTLKIAEKEKEKAWEQRSEAQDAVKYTPVGMVNPQIEAAYASLLQAELNYQIKRKGYLNLQDDIKQKVIEKYINVLTSLSGLNKVQKAYEQASWEKRVGQIKVREGLLSQVALTGINAAYEKAQGELVQAKENLNKAYVELNALVGYLPEERPNLVTNVEYSPLEVRSITSDINRAMNENTDVWAALQNITIERQDLRMTLQPYDVEKIEIDIAKLTAEQAKDELEKQLYLLYYDIMSLEGSIKAAEEAVGAAEEALRSVQLMYDLGMAVKGDLLEAEVNLATARVVLDELKHTHVSATATYRNITGREVMPTIS